MSVPSAELTVPSARADARAASVALTARIAGGRLYLVMAGVALVIAALSLLIPSTPSYDPWSWLVWGREVAHLDLQTTGGPTWKPLPVIFTTVFSLFGKAAPDLWLVVARAGALMAVAMVFKMCVRLTRQLAMRGDDDVAPAGAFGPAILAGLVAAFGLTFAGGDRKSVV